MAKKATEDVQTRFGRRVRELRVAKGYSQESFADECGLDRTYIGGIERGERNLSLKNIEVVAVALGITVSELTLGLQPVASQNRQLEQLVAGLSVDKRAILTSLATALESRIELDRNKDSDLFPDDSSALIVANYLVLHHCLSREVFRGEKFEFALGQAAGTTGKAVKYPDSRTHPGHDLTVDGVGWSLKTTGEVTSNTDKRVHISKWMELGKGEWPTTDEGLSALHDKFLAHLRGYERIFLLRYRSQPVTTKHKYECIEVPKSLFLETERPTFKLSVKSRAESGKPGTGVMSDESGTQYELYFDGKGERKLRVQKLRRDLCVHHATWEFENLDPSAPVSTGEE